jgi:hypothetical protein
VVWRGERLTVRVELEVLGQDLVGERGIDVDEEVLEDGDELLGFFVRNAASIIVTVDKRGRVGKASE